MESLMKIYNLVDGHCVTHIIQLLWIECFDFGQIQVLLFCLRNHHCGWGLSEQIKPSQRALAKGLGCLLTKTNTKVMVPILTQLVTILNYFLIKSSKIHLDLSFKLPFKKNSLKVDIALRLFCHMTSFCWGGKQPSRFCWLTIFQFHWLKNWVMLGLIL